MADDRAQEPSASPGPGTGRPLSSSLRAEPFYQSFSSAPISSSYPQAPSVGAGGFGNQEHLDPYAGMGYDRLPDSNSPGSSAAPHAAAPITSPPAPAPHAPVPHTPAPHAPGEPPSIEDLYRAPGNPYASHSGRPAQTSAPSTPAAPSGAAPYAYTGAPGGAPGNQWSAAPQPGLTPQPGQPRAMPGQPAKRRSGAGCLVSMIVLITIGAMVIGGIVSFIRDFGPSEGFTPSPATSQSAGLAPVADTELEEGMCFLDLNYVSGNRLQPVDCAEPHRYEVSQNITVSGSYYPGETAIAEDASTGCQEVAASITQEFDTRPLTHHSLYPSESTWDAGDRTISCFISMAGSHRLHGSAHDGDLEVY